MNRPAHGHVRAARPRTRPAGATTALTPGGACARHSPAVPGRRGRSAWCYGGRGRHPAAPGPAPDCQQRHLRPHPA